MNCDVQKNGRGRKRENEPSTSENEQMKASKKAKIQRQFNFSAHPQRKIALKFLYFGWEYDGLVQQANTKNTVEEHLMVALQRTCLITDWKECDISRCGRTDKGVSAFEQVAALIVRSSDPNGEYVFWDNNVEKEVKDQYKGREELNYIKMLNGVLPSTIRITAWAPVPRDFSARHACNMRVYKYTMPKANLDLKKIKQASKYLVGEHDFRNFCQIDSNEARLQACYVRKIYDVEVELASSENGSYDIIELTVKGSGFLWHMIRFIVSVLHDVGQGNEHPEIVETLLNISKTPSRPQYHLAAETPLCLFHCRYDSHNLNWKTDTITLEKTISSLQETWADLTTRAQLVKNMIDDLQTNEETKINKGLLQFTQDRPLPAKYIPYAMRPVCDSLEERREKLKKKKLI